MIDAVEWLIVSRNGDDPQSLHVDDITLDQDVADVVNDRVNRAPVSSLAPGQTVTLVVTAFNRGWGRYRLLDNGQYRIMLRYVPPWGDEALEAARVGLVESNEALLTILAAAPDTVSRRGVDASIEVTIEGEHYVARLTNRRDLSAVVNVNFGLIAPFAQGRWVCERESSIRDVSATPDAKSDWSEFTGVKLREVKPGDAIELDRVDRRELNKRLAMLGLDPRENGSTLYFSYSNMCDRNWQRKQDRVTITALETPGVLRDALPIRMLTGWHTSNRIRTDEPDGQEPRE
jgi:hypothetical protein